MKWHTQAVKITTNIRVGIYFTLPEISATKIVTWNFQADESAKRKYGMILGRYILTELGLNTKSSDHIIESNDGSFKGSTSTMVDMGTYGFSI